MRVARAAIAAMAVGILAYGGSFSSVVAGQRAPAAPPAPPPPSIEHGRYLVEQVAMCGECHSGRNAQGVVVDGQRFMGAPIPFAPPWPNDWATRAPRIRGLVGYTDDLAIRLLTEGAIGRDGAPLKRPMPAFRMTRQDALDVIAYLRSLP